MENWKTEVLKQCLNNRTGFLKRSKPKVTGDHDLDNKVEYLWVKTRFEAGLGSIHSMMYTRFLITDLDPSDIEYLDKASIRLSEYIDPKLSAKRDFALGLGADYLKS